jgi:hypothetical protein
MLSPDGKNYLGKLGTNLIRTTAQKMADWAAANGDAAKPAATDKGSEATPPIDLSTPQLIANAYRSGLIKRWQAEAEAAKHGYTPDVPATAPHAPQAPVN